MNQKKEQLAGLASLFGLKNRKTRLLKELIEVELEITSKLKELIAIGVKI